MWPFKKKFTKEEIIDIANEVSRKILDEYKEELNNLTYVPGYEPPQGTAITPKTVRDVLSETLIMIKLTNHPDAWIYGDDETNNYGIFEPNNNRSVTLGNGKKISDTGIILNFYIRERGKKGVIEFIHQKNHVVADRIYIYTIEEAREYLSKWLQND